MHVRELFDLSGKVAIVTGGGTGIGRQMAQGLAEAGADLVLCARKAERCEKAAAEISAELGVRAFGMSCDVRDQDQIKAVLARAQAELGAVDILVNNSGTTWGQPPEEHSLDGWQKVIDVNLTGVFLFAQAAGRVMIAQGHGKIVNIASIMSFRAADPEIMDTIAYNTSKGGVLNFTRDLAVKWAGKGINVNAIAPGWFPSEMASKVIDQNPEAYLRYIPLRRFGGGDDLKGAIVYLTSRASDYVTGETLVVDGGELAW
jgi:NAD(P)-dependent dehydrogenase (short-subunit alcohol dehydrogenase family)